MNLKYLVLTGDVPSIPSAAMFLMMVSLTIRLLMKNPLCSCP